jgi:hypothetical protein
MLIRGDIRYVELWDTESKPVRTLLFGEHAMLVNE